MKYCLDCDWSVSDEPDADRQTADSSDAEGGDSDAPDPSERAVVHVAETGHSIESDGPPFPRALLDRNHPDLRDVLPVTPRRDRCGMNG